MWIVFVVLCVALFGGLYFYSKKDAVNVSNIDGTKMNTGSNESGGIKDIPYGNTAAKVTLIEYGDYQCPACHQMHPIVKSLIEENKASMQFVFRNFPITNSHPNARAAAASAEAAGIQGKFWEMHNALYERYDEWVNTTGDERTTVFKTIARSTGIDGDQFLKVLTDRSSDINKKINFDKGIALKQGVDATPTFFLNGRKLEGDAIKTTDAFKKTLADEIAKNQ